MMKGLTGLRVNIAGLNPQPTNSISILQSRKCLKSAVIKLETLLGKEALDLLAHRIEANTAVTILEPPNSIHLSRTETKKGTAIKKN